LYEVKPSENQPLGLSEDYKRNANFIRSIKPKDRGKSIYNSRLLRPKQDKRIIDVAAKVTASVLFNSGTIEISGFINGIDIVAEDKLFKISDYIREGKVTDLSQNNSIIIGKGLSDKMLLIKGDIIKFQLLMGIVVKNSGYFGDWYC
jgi:lipoprotein-releasing system permease protein